MTATRFLIWLTNAMQAGHFPRPLELKAKLGEVTLAEARRLRTALDMVIEELER